MNLLSAHCYFLLDTMYCMQIDVFCIRDNCVTDCVALQLFGNICFVCNCVVAGDGKVVINILFCPVVVQLLVLWF